VEPYRSGENGKKMEVMVMIVGGGEEEGGN